MAESTTAAAAVQPLGHCWLFAAKEGQLVCLNSLFEKNTTLLLQLAIVCISVLGCVVKESSSSISRLRDFLILPRLPPDWLKTVMITVESSLSLQPMPHFNYAFERLHLHRGVCRYSTLSKVADILKGRGRYCVEQRVT